MMPAEALTLGDHALAYAQRGYEVFPVSPADKAPLAEHGMNDATSDPARVAAWWREHPDALIGCRIPADVVVLDVDPRHGGDRTWQVLQDHYGALEAGRVHLSGRGDGGGHHWFRKPPGKLSARPLHEFARANGTGHAAGKRSWTSGIDVLHHNHRYTILPPSPHPTTGAPYTWRFQGEPEAMPAWLAHYLVAPDAPAARSLPDAPPTRLRIADEDSIADWFSATHSWADILTDWVLVAGDGDTDGSLWRHPNATAAHSASVRHGCLFVYSPNTDLDETEEGNPRGYTRFRAWAELEHGGDMRAAARAAREQRDPPIVPRSPLGTSTTPPRVHAADAVSTAAVHDEPDDEPDSDWARVDLVTVARELADGTRAKEVPTIVDVAGALPLFYRGRVNQLHGASGDGKSWIGLWACVEALRRGEMVMYVDWEDNPDGVAARLLALGCAPDDLVLFDYRNPSSGLGSTLAFEGLAGCTELPYAVVVIDSTGEAMAAGAIDGNVDAEVAAWFRNAKAISRWPSTPAVILVDHIPKATDAPAGAIGSQRKTAAITGASYRTQQMVPFAIGKPGMLRLTVHKDRLGHRAKGSTACEAHIGPGAAEGTVNISCRISEAQEAAAKGEQFRPTVLMERVSRWLEEHPGGWTGRAIETNVTGKGPALRLALKVLVDESYVTETKAQRGCEYASERPFRDVELPPRPTASHRVPTASRDAVDHPETTASTASPCINDTGTRDAVVGVDGDNQMAPPRPRGRGAQSKPIQQPLGDDWKGIV